MLDFSFKASWVVDNYVGCKNAIYFIIEYDMNDVIPYFMTNFEWLNPFFQVKAIALVDGFAFEGEEEKTNMFGV